MLSNKFDVTLRCCRYKDSVANYQTFSVSTQASMSLLNVIQALIIASTCLVAMIVAANAVLHGTMDVGGFVAVNAYTLAIFAPLNFLGSVYMAIVQGLIDVQNLIQLLGEDPDIQDKSDAPPIPIISQYYGPNYDIDNIPKDFGSSTSEI